MSSPFRNRRISSSSSDHPCSSPKNVKCDESRLAAPEQQLAELRLATGVEADNFHHREHVDGPLRSRINPWERPGSDLNAFPFREKPHFFTVGKKKCTKPVPFNFKDPVWIREWRTGAAKRHRSEMRERHHKQSTLCPLPSGKLKRCGCLCFKPKGEPPTMRWPHFGIWVHWDCSFWQS